MRHARWLVSVFALVVGCALPPERQPVKALPDDGTPLTYADLVRRAGDQAIFATESLHIDRWADIEETGKDLAKTALLLTKATDVPARQRDKLAIHASDLGKEAESLQEAAKARNVKLANDSLQRLNLKVRELRARN